MQEDVKILDIGCGKNKYPDSIGIDFNPASDADIIHDLTEFPYPFKDNKFDMVFSNDFIEHLNDLERVKMMDEIHRIAKPHSKIVIITPHVSRCTDWGNIVHKRLSSIYSFGYLEPQSYEIAYYQLMRKKQKRFMPV
jgi:predicted SAM-dependent methyltransferase